MHAPRVYNPLIRYVEYPETQEEIYAKLSEKDIERLKEYVMQLINNDDMDTAVLILSRLVCFNNIHINECLELLIEKEHYYPGILFKNASQSIRDLLIDKLEHDAEKRNDILIALSWIGDSKVVELFNNRRKKLTDWSKELYISPEECSFEAGWMLTEEGNREDLFYSKCYPLIVGEPSHSEPICIIDKHEDICPWCGTRMTTLFDIDLKDPVFHFMGLKGERLKVSTCHVCACYGDIYTEIDFNGLSKWYNGNKKPNYLPEISNPEDEVLKVSKSIVISKVPRNPYFAANHLNDTAFSQIGGHPTWIQRVQYPLCPKCWKPMRFIGQFDCGYFVEYGEGIYYAFICEDCNMAATHYQAT